MPRGSMSKGPCTSQHKTGAQCRRGALHPEPCRWWISNPGPGGGPTRLEWTDPAREQPPAKVAAPKKKARAPRASAELATATEAVVAVPLEVEAPKGGLVALVGNCGTCPLWNAVMDRCSHPGAGKQEVAMQHVVGAAPDWCPLRDGALLVRLGHSARA